MSARRKARSTSCIVGIVGFVVAWVLAASLVFAILRVTGNYEIEDAQIPVLPIGVAFATAVCGSFLSVRWAHRRARRGEGTGIDAPHRIWRS